MTFIEPKDSTKQTENIFQNILIQKDKKPNNLRNNKHLFEKIQKSLSFTKYIK